MTVKEINSMLERNDRDRVEQSLPNYILVLSEDDSFRGKIKFNELSRRTELGKGLPWERSNGPLDDFDLTYFRNYLETNYKLFVEKNIVDAIKYVAYQNRYHPIADYLNSLKPWDGHDRTGEILSYYLGAENNGINREFLRLFMLGAVKRVFEPGCKFDYMLCLTGDQGVGKSSFLRLLAVKDEWFCDDISNIADENIYQYLMGHWIIELAELVALTNAKSIEATKAQLSRQSDNFRIPYNRYKDEYPRRCVFSGSTNKTEFLPFDKSGNRRFLPISCNIANRTEMVLENEKKARKYIDLLWGQIMYIYRNENPSAVLSEEAEKELAGLQEYFTPEDSDEGLIRTWIEDTGKDVICSRMIYKECLNNYSDPKRYELAQISETVNGLISKGIITDFERSGGTVRIPEYGAQKAWVRKKKEPQQIVINGKSYEIEEIL